MTDETTLDLTKPEDVLKLFVAVQQNEKVLEDRIEELKTKIAQQENTVQELQFQIEIFARMTEKLLITKSEDKVVTKVTTEEYRVLAEKCKREFVQELKKTLSNISN